MLTNGTQNGIVYNRYFDRAVVLQVQVLPPRPYMRGVAQSVEQIVKKLLCYSFYPFAFWLVSRVDKTLPFHGKNGEFNSPTSHQKAALYIAVTSPVKREVAGSSPVLPPEYVGGSSVGKST